MLRMPMPPTRYRYGDNPLNFADLHRAAGKQSRGTVVLIHGGYWRWNPDYFEGPTNMAYELAANGFNVWQVEYRALGSGGGWPTTLNDIDASIARLGELRHEADLHIGAMISVGHSAGGHLAVLALGLPESPLVGAVALAGVLELRLAERENLGGGAVRDFLGGSPVRHPARYESANPAQHPTASKPVRLIHGTADRVVPVSQSLSYQLAGRAVGQDVTLAEFDGDHFEIIDPSHPSWSLTLAAVVELTH
jgi:acetyl esterase/lipase